MMDDRNTDRLLRDAFRRNAPHVDEVAIQGRVDEELPRRRRRHRVARVAWALAVAGASLALVGMLAFGVYEAVTYLRDQQPALVLSDLQVPATDTAPSGGNTTGTKTLSGLLPVAGTAILHEVAGEGTTVQANGVTQVRGRVLAYALDMSQAGVGGILEISTDLDVSADGSATVQGTWVLRSDQGTWECPSWIGYTTADGLEEFGFGRALGTGAYEGLALFLQWHAGTDAGSAAPVARWGIVTGWVERVK
jgi:hypothetical protein